MQAPGPPGGRTAARCERAGKPFRPHRMRAPVPVDREPRRRRNERPRQGARQHVSGENIRQGFLEPRERLLAYGRRAILNASLQADHLDWSRWHALVNGLSASDRERMAPRPPPSRRPQVIVRLLQRSPYEPKHREENDGRNGSRYGTAHGSGSGAGPRRGTGVQACYRTGARRDPDCGAGARSGAPNTGRTRAT